MRSLRAFAPRDFICFCAELEFLVVRNERMFYGVQYCRKGREKKQKGQVLRVIFSRTALILLLILLQLATFAGLLTILKDYMVYIYGVILVVQAGVIIYIMNEQTCPEFTRTWILLILIFPVFGCAFYVYAKLELGTHFVGEQLKKRQMETWPYLNQKKEYPGGSAFQQAGQRQSGPLYEPVASFPGIPQYKGDLFQLRGGKISGSDRTDEAGEEIYLSRIFYCSRGIYVGLDPEGSQGEGGTGTGCAFYVRRHVQYLAPSL